MPFVPKVWKSKDQGTPYTYVTAEELNRIEQGISSATELAEQGGGASGISVTDNGNGTFTIDDTSNTALVDHGDGTFTLTA